MLDFLNPLALAFIPLFIAIDVLGILPIFLSYTKGWEVEARRRLIAQATFAALALSFVFLFSGKALFGFMGITQDDFRIGGGIVLLVLALMDLFVNEADSSRRPDQGTGVVPIGVPLMVGPAALTTILMVGENQGAAWASVAIILNLGIVWIVFRQSHWIMKVLGAGGSQVIAKITSLFMVAIAVMMIRVGVQGILAG